MRHGRDGGSGSFARSSGPLAHAVGNAIGLGSTSVTLWNWLKWPILLVIVAAMIAVLYYIAPNVKQPGLRWLTPGSAAALIAWLVASALFALYVAHFASYNKTYGSLGGVVALLVWLWVSNLALLFGLEFDAELERTRELQRGDRDAMQKIQLPPRDPPKPTT
jgi:membrane protein